MNTPAGQAPLILVVDDSPLNLEPLCDLLASLHYRVAPALDGPTALRLAAASPPDLAVLDIMMPGMDGLEVCRRLRADPRTATVPVVFVTALSDSADKLRAIEAGGDDFLTKPFDRPVLLARIRSLLRLKAASDALEVSCRQLQAMKRLRDDLMQMIVHDLKSPLTTILAALEITLDGELGALGAEQARLLADARDRGDDMLQLVNDLLELARLEDATLELSRQPLRLDALLGEVGERWRLRAEREGAALAVQAEAGLGVAADERLLRRVLDNLVGNALRHAGRGVHVRLQAAAAPGDEVVISVCDDGVGIEPARQVALFGAPGDGGLAALPRPGHGLGLSFCRLAAEAHGGRIWLESEPGRGSVFHLALPHRLGAPVQVRAPSVLHA